MFYETMKRCIRFAAECVHIKLETYTMTFNRLPSFVISQSLSLSIYFRIDIQSRLFRFVVFSYIISLLVFLPDGNRGQCS